MGKIGWIDLSGRTLSEYPLREREAYPGGKILNQRLLLELLSGKEAAFSEENPLILSTGPLTGTGAPGSLRFDVAALSPKDDRPAFSNCGGSFGLHLKQAGYDALILTGRCSEPCWLELSEAGVRFHDAGALWGTNVSDCRKGLEAALGRNSLGTLCIGPAGENLVKFASILADGHSAGRAGLGAVMGWKNLKAIGCFGAQQIPLHDPQGAAALNREWYERLRQQGRKGKTADTAAFCTGCPLHCPRHARGDSALPDELGMDAIAAMDALRWAEARGIATETLLEDIAHRRGIGDALAEGCRIGKEKGGTRRGGSHRAIAAAFGLTPGTPETDRFCRCLTEAVSAAGQCMFTLNSLSPPEAPELPTARMLTLVTGRKLDLEGLLAIGEQSLALERQLNEKWDQ